MSNEIMVHEGAGALETWDGAAARGLQRRRDREAIVGQVLKKDQDYGKIPGVDKPILFKAGAEKINDSLNLYPNFERIQIIEDWDRPLFHYTYRCVLRHRGTDVPVATGIGSCNSMESKYRWRNSERICPKCSQPAIIKGKEEYGGGWLCWPRKGGCNSKFATDDPAIANQSLGKIENDDIYSIVNTVDKMAQVRALKGATRNLGFSDHFEDMDDDADAAPSGSSAKPQQSVKQPQKKAEAAAPSTWSGTLREITTKTGKKKNGQPWTLYELHGHDNTLLCTFDTKLSEQAQAFLESGEQIEISYTVTSQGGFNVQSIAAHAPEEAAAA